MRPEPQEASHLTRFSGWSCFKVGTNCQPQEPWGKSLAPTETWGRCHTGEQHSDKEVCVGVMGVHHWHNGTMSFLEKIWKWPHAALGIALGITLHCNDVTSLFLDILNSPTASFGNPKLAVWDLRKKRSSLPYGTHDLLTGNHHILNLALMYAKKVLCLNPVHFDQRLYVLLSNHQPARLVYSPKPWKW